MKLVVLFILFALTFSCSIFSQGTIDSPAVVIFEKCLLVIKKHVDGKESNSDKISKTINFLTDLTGIGSESDGNFAGQFNPTNDDYIRWSQWLALNREFIHLDKKSGNLVIR